MGFVPKPTPQQPSEFRNRAMRMQLSVSVKLTSIAFVGRDSAAAEYLPLKGRANRIWLRRPAPRYGATSLPVIPADPGLDPGESRNPVIKAVRAFTPAVDYWVPARASPVEPGSLGRDDNSYAFQEEV